jgi:hypothetical protein
MTVKLGLGNKTYDILKFIAQIALPAVTSLYFALSQIWSLPDTEQVIGTLTVIDTFLGGLLGLSSKTYSPPVDGHVVVDDSDPDIMGMQVKFHNPNEIPGKSVIKLQVQAGPLPAPPIPGPHGGGM